MSSFGEVTYAEGGPSEASATTTHGANGSAATEIIDINDPRLMSEPLNFNPEGDAYAVPPPIPDGKWRAKLKQQDIKDSKGVLQRTAAFCYPKMNDGKPFVATNVEFTVLTADEKFDGYKLTEYWVKTAKQRDGSNQVSTLLAKGKQPLNSADPAGVLMSQFLKWLAGEPELVIETAWEAACQSCQESAKKKGEKAPRPFLLGMHRFPQTRTGPDPIVKCPEGHQVRAQARIAQFWPVDAPHNK